MAEQSRIVSAGRYWCLSAYRLTLVMLVSLSAVTGMFVLSAARVSAAVTHEFLPAPTAKISEGVPASSGAKLTGTISEPAQMTGDSRHIWIAERFEGQSQQQMIDEFDASSGTFLSQINEEGGVTSLANSGIAVGRVGSEEQIYDGAGQNGSQVVAVFGATGKLQGTWTGANTPNGSFGQPAVGGTGAEITGVATDGSPNLETKGDVYVATAITPGSDSSSFNVVDVFKPEAPGVEPAKVVAQLEGTCESPGTCPGKVIPFVRPTAIAVSSFNGDVLVVDNLKVVDVFEPTLLGGYAFVRQLTGTPAGTFEQLSEVINKTGVVVDKNNGDIYVVDRRDRQKINKEGEGLEVVDEFDATGEYVGQLTGVPGGSSGETRPFHNVVSVAVDPVTDHVFVGEIFHLQSMSGGRVGAVDVFGPDRVVPDVVTEESSEVGAFSVRVNGEVNPKGEGEASCRFDYGTTVEFGLVASCEPEKVADGTGLVGVHATLSGLRSGTTYFYRLRASNKNGANAGEPWQVRQFKTLGPGLHSESVSNVASTSATFAATIDPEGVATSYYFQYGTSTEYGSEFPSAPGTGIGSGEGDVDVTRHVQELLPNTTYHYRVVVVSEVTGKAQVFLGADQTFRTQGAGSTLVLPDGRQWEQVSPVDKHGARVLPILVQGLLQAAGSGGAISYPTSLPTEGGAQGYFEVEQVFSRRSANGWSSEDISLPHSSSVGTVLGAGSEFRLFSEELSSVAVEPFGHFTSLAPCVSPLDSERTPYIRSNNTPCGGRMGTYEPLLTSEDVLSGAAFGGDPTQKPYIGEAQVVDASSDLSHVLLKSTVGLTPPPKAGENGKGVFHEGHDELYEWSAGKSSAEILQPVSVLPNNTFAREPALGYRSLNTRGAVSADGTRVVWDANSDGGHLYDRDLVAGSTIVVDTPQAACVASKECGDGVVEPVFQFASRDGSRVFFTDTQRLTANAGVVGSTDLYVCEIVKGACVLQDLTATGAGSGVRVDVQGLLPGGSEDGSSVYFVANGVLVAGASQGACHGTESPSGATCDLYVESRGGAGWGAPRLVGVLGGEDWPDWKGERAGGLLTGLGELTSRVSGDGRFLAFMSDRSLTGYDNRDVLTGRPDEEVFLYDAQGNGGAGRLVCASCNPTGARPVGVEYQKLQRGLTGSEASDFAPSQGIASSVPGWTPFQLGNARYQSRYLSGQGRLFFASSDALVPQDINRNEDVYEFEPAGLGDCTVSSSTFSEVSGGCVSLISSGTADSESGFLDASVTGSDVFFMTGERLVSADVDTAFDVYDAHVCSPGSPCVSYPTVSPACTTADGCRAAPTPQPAIFGAPSSATFTGTGNMPPGGTGAVIQKARPLSAKQKLARALRACHKGRRKRRALCERQAHKRYAAKQAGTGNANGKGRR